MIPGMIRHASSDETVPPLGMIFLFDSPSPHHLFVARNGWHSVNVHGLNKVIFTSPVVMKLFKLHTYILVRYICDLWTLNPTDVCFKN